ncbi:hypothetical protein A1351_20235 [Methylosinus sp. R-45379]|uniref:hypothetical protein n=1 Tax=Methylosinus sp. R-45379 TaxID=980563 RepID=UPI0007D7F8EF|nr:hypothetical protein [Methylosinus sp. R-45379]OAI22899.1 hypothetical protein A1351_20235 [Methylosinus sp. R-45379]
MKYDEIERLGALLRAGAPIEGDEIEAFRQCLLDSGWCDSTVAREYMAIAAMILARLTEAPQRLPDRRAGEAFEFEFEGTQFSCTLGFYPDGRLGEIFLNGLKLDNAQDIYARDLGIALSIGLRHRAPFDLLRKAMTRAAGGKPQGLGGFILDVIAEHGQ